MTFLIKFIIHNIIIIQLINKLGKQLVFKKKIK